MNRCIVKKEGKFEVMGYQGEESPVEAVLAIGEKYYSIYNGLQFVWNTSYFDINYKEFGIESLSNSNAHSVADFMNRYYEMEESDLDKLIPKK